MPTGYKIISESVITSPTNHKHQLVDATVKLPGGKTAVWQYVRSRDVVGIIALTDDNSVYCVRQWRPTRKDYVWELPAGGVEAEHPSDKQVLDNANRELQEEIGMKADKLVILAKFTPTIHIDSNYYVVLATDLKPHSLPNDPVERLEIKTLPFDQAYNLLVNQQLPSALTLISLLLAKPHIFRVSKPDSNLTL
ncbi:hypothetical protein A2634_01795 [Candidatus Amesbacteria bacterium RIFCSPHIGHO2_01_FULL_48_32]|uniref:Nudix hydrolase domain-containing protein n=1 Tax=Candidatus Amesbacteria bacterium RIFCSPLOWO2_01_FULL_48_25 TaxID=1797259 RepID=A0A1F4ZAY2_9BACT|nr:MAG: hypothetical protein A2634_01795 [Candidatus Amesbacteria bacterium RIFCSPHIGHO2_01_FULL_48_32]OGD03392.1 MAG: hypothetical protein A2989_00995 [Candidatus Amesbacteria bacterium RIFCSPLOWO2_01_FULL_48_25]HJZ05009.1 NUDIX hydrolase [Patescibacteria group bacterium]